MSTIEVPRRSVKRAVIALVIRSCGEREPPQVLAVTNRRYGGLSLPGGKVEAHEHPRDALVRELWEETALDVDPLAVVEIAAGVNTVADEQCLVGVHLVFFARGTPRDVEEGTRHEWTTWASLLERSPFRAFYERHFPDGIRHLRVTRFASAYASALGRFLGA